MPNIYDNAPREIRNFMTYLVTVRGRSQKTANEYFLDLRTFFRFILTLRKIVPPDTPFDSISIDSVDLALIKSITVNDIYDYLSFVANDRPKFHKSSVTTYGNAPKARARKTSSLRSFYKYLVEKVNLIEYNPTQNIDVVKARQSLPKYLTLDESITLLDSISGTYAIRNHCIITIFLNCGLRVSELVGLNLSDVTNESMRVLGKGNKERTVYLNNACREAISNYLPHRIAPKNSSEQAMFVSKMGNRINVQTVKWIVKEALDTAGLAQKGCSVHKLRHTAATLMYQNGVDIRVLQDVLGHDNLNTTTIYTHIKDENLKDAADLNPLGKLKLNK